MRRLLGLALLLVASPAAARDLQPVVSAPLVLGFDQHSGVDTDNKFAIGWRPEIIVASVHGDGGPGLGLYGEVEHAGATWLGGGMTGAYYVGSLGVAASGGIDQRTLDGTHRLTTVFGGFFGLRHIDQELMDHGFWIDIPIGVRLDVRPGLSDVPTSIALQLQIDVPGIALFFVHLAKYPNFGH